MFERWRNSKAKKKSEDDKGAPSSSSSTSTRNKGTNGAPVSTVKQPPPPLPLVPSSAAGVASPVSAQPSPPPSASFPRANNLMPAHSSTLTPTLPTHIALHPAPSVASAPGHSTANSDYVHNYKVPIVETRWTNNDREKQELNESRPRLTPAPANYISHGATGMQPSSLQQQQQYQQQQQTATPQRMVRMSIDPISHQVTYNTINTLPQLVGTNLTQLTNNGSSTALSSPPSTSTAPPPTITTTTSVSATPSIPASTALPSSSLTATTNSSIAIDRRLSNGQRGSIPGLPKSFTTRTQAAHAAATAATVGVVLPSSSSSSSSSPSSGGRRHGSGTPASAASAASSPSPSRSSSTSNRAAADVSVIFGGENGQTEGFSSGSMATEGSLYGGTSSTSMTKLPFVGTIPSSTSSGAGSLSPSSVTPPLTPQMVHQNVVVLPDQLSTSVDPTTTDTAMGEQQTNSSPFMVQSPLSAEYDPNPLAMPPLSQSTVGPTLAPLPSLAPMDDEFFHDYAPRLSGIISMSLPVLGDSIDQNAAAQESSTTSVTTQDSVTTRPPLTREQLLGQQQAYQEQEMQVLEQLLGSSEQLSSDSSLSLLAQQQQSYQQEQQQTSSEVETSTPLYVPKPLDEFVPTPLDDSKDFVRHGLNTTIDHPHHEISRVTPRHGSVSSVQPTPPSTRAPPIPRATHPNLKDRKSMNNLGLGIESGARVIATHPPVPAGSLPSHSSSHSSTSTSTISMLSTATTTTTTSSSSPPTNTTDSTMTMSPSSGPPPSSTPAPSSAVQFEAGSTGVPSIARASTLMGSHQQQHHRPMSATLARAGTQSSLLGLITHDLKQSSEQTHIEEGAGPLTLIAIGKTGQGKSSLLNRIMGTSELKASASVRAVTKGIAERSGWGRFEDTRRVLVTLADTPGLADTEGDDEKNIPLLKEYIKSIGTRLGVSAFLLVFKIDSGVDMVITILTTFNEIMQEYPQFWENVVLVFTGCDYRRNVQKTKELYHAVLQNEMNERFFKNRPSSPTATGGCDESNGNGEGANGNNSNGQDEDSSSSPGQFPEIPMVFLTTAEPVCGFALGERCDCKAQNAFLNNGLRRLWYKVRDLRRWVIKPDCQEDDFNHS
ncbi:hypothetical protein BGZ73_002386 [Actinomortierella ambigua]|nr:hypothetical protein BGZ73_002386 [Actinomortierella ambigua]